MKGKQPSKSAMIRKEHSDQDVAELLLRLSPNDPDDVKKAREIAQEYFGLKGKQLEDFIEKWSVYSDID